MATPTNSNSSFDPSVLRNRDGFFTALYRFFDGLGKHALAVWIALGAMVAVGVVVGLVAGKSEEKTQAGNNAIFLAQKAYESEMKALAGVKTPSPVAKGAKEADEKAKQAEQAASAKKLEEVAFQKLDVDAKFPETVSKLKSVISQFPGTRPAYEARMKLGDLYFVHGDANKALPFYKDASSSAPGSMEKAFAYSALGYSFENAGQTAEALKAFEKALNQGEPSLKGDLLLAMARCQKSLNDPAKAKTTYDQIIAQMPNTEAARTAETLKSRL